MLSQLTIQNFGLIDKCSIDFEKGLNTLTGATGAGKSIIIDGLRCVLGEKISASHIRDKDKPCLVEAVFDLPRKTFANHLSFQDFLQEEDGPVASLIIQRQYFSDGRAKIKINGLTVTLTQLRELGNHLIDFHGPHDHQMLFSPTNHLTILDQLTDFGKDLEHYQSRYKIFKDLERQWEELKNLSNTSAREIDLLQHQIQELEQVPLSDEKYELLHQELVKIRNAEKLYQLTSSILQTFESGNPNISEIIQSAFSPLRTLNQIDEKTSALTTYLENVQENSESLLSELKDYLDSLSFQPQDAEKINQQYDAYENIRRKYGPTLQEAQCFYTQAKEKYDLLTNLEHNDQELKSQMAALEKELGTLAKKLTQSRKKTADFLKKVVEKELRDLGIDHVTFEARITSSEFQPHGHDEVVFYISPNLGESLKPLSEIVSSGEAARVMLALKKALIKVDPIPVLIFDEIDAQIGGRLGTITGKKLKELSLNRQVLLITHLPQIASFADRHLKVLKTTSAGKTFTQIQLLENEERVTELAQMMSGTKKSDISLSHAEEMLAKAQES
ncbi:MAG: DNA repair protein RecN [Candidatus Omnitrophica bacterium]|nr:DNA repair protein RecN [Candidatus Omnitrophota bacterium]